MKRSENTNQEARIETGLMEKFSLMAFCSWFAQLDFLYHQGPYPEMTLPKVGWILLY